MKPLLLHLINSFKRGGAEVLLKNTVNLLPDYRHLVVYLHPPDEMKKEFQGDIRFTCLHHNGWKNIFSSISKLKRIIREEKPKLIHAHLFDATLIGRRARPASIPFLFTIHNIMSKDAFEVNRKSLWAEKLTYRSNQVILAVSKEALKDYDQWVGIKGESHVLYNYVDDAFFGVPSRPSAPFRPYMKLVAVGNLRRQKNYHTLFRAFEQLKQLPIHLDIYGGGDLKEELQQWIREKQLNIELKGRVNAVADHMQDYHAYIMPSLFEGFGIAPMEAMAAGLPVLLSDLPVFREIAADKPIYFDPHSPEAMAAAIRHAYENWQAVLQQSAGNREWARQIASREVYIRKLRSLYDNY